VTTDYGDSTTVYEEPYDSGTVIVEPDESAPASPPPPPPPADADTQGVESSAGTSAFFTMHVPSDARVYVNGMRTQSTGEVRRYVSHGLVPGLRYKYAIRAEVQRDGKTLRDTRVVQVRAGEVSDVAFHFQTSSGQIARSPATTTLTLNVPADAQVTLAGNPTTSRGATREFSTAVLAAGQQWDDYQVVVTVTRDGQPVSQEKTITLTGGQSRTLAFDFAETHLAQRTAR
jgi:uncharacterized protein (TIGR03000 family)